MGLASSLTGEKVVVVTNWPELLKEPVYQTNSYKWMEQDLLA